MVEPALAILDRTSGQDTSSLRTRMCNAVVRPLSRQEALAGLFVVLFINGAIIRAFEAADFAGPDRWIGAALNTFGISVIVWAALWLGLRFLLRASPTAVTGLDALIAALAVGLSLLPSASPTWVGMTAVAYYLAHTVPKQSAERRAAWVLMAVTVPMFWSKLFFSIFSDRLLGAEAALIGSAMGTPHSGNLVQFANGSGFMEIWPACSSFANVSLAFLCWIAFSQAVDHKRSALDAGWCVLACLAVVAINVCRISLIGFFPEHYDLLHGSVGASVAGWLTLLASACVCAFGVGWFKGPKSSRLQALNA